MTALEKMTESKQLIERVRFLKRYQTHYNFMQEAIEQGACTLRQITDWMNDKDITTPTGAMWHPTSTMRVLKAFAEEETREIVQ